MKFAAAFGVLARLFHGRVLWEGWVSSWQGFIAKKPGKPARPGSLRQGPGLARDIERKLRHHHVASMREANQIDGAGILGDTIPHPGGAVPVAERHIVGTGRGDFRIADEPARTQPRAAIGVRMVMAMP